MYTIGSCPAQAGWLLLRLRDGKAGQGLHKKRGKRLDLRQTTRVYASVEWNWRNGSVSEHSTAPTTVELGETMSRADNDVSL